ncbi:S-adenosyl-L-methionine-dependent methyltransferase [Mucor mucedo]|uniref:S-adenosyl-L-methionine-dependent methyltransferase n=1 Tax=Mucor mucedo TaxID=29922 RepID=UPI00221F0E94|nr:S-adenosyl-L-methionine-dependent methyltransferase [Mucor mucedo]KAI7895598.1 S-adenosyl-L-methionine-dependent methyltransferase [Mucor mucedo]
MHTGASVLVGYICILPVISSYTDGWIQHVLLYLHALGVSCMLYLLVNPATSDNNEVDENEIYGLRHLLFNLELPPKTLWFNMGLWDKPGLSFPQACENLVHKVAQFINIKPMSSVLDVGFGCGDSCIVFAEQYQSQVTGITNELSQWRIAKERVSTLPSKINVLHGSADTLDKHVSSTFDYIISIDSAYHYNTRWNFIQAAFKHLNEGGVLGLYDLCIDPDLYASVTPIKRQILKLVCQAVHIPLENLVTPEEYEKRVEDAGYKKVDMVCLDRMLVFGGLSQSFHTQYETTQKYGIGMSLSNRMTLKVSGFLFGLLATRSWLVPVLIKAEKVY